MKKLLNTLFVTTQGAYLHKEGESVLVKVENDIKLRVPIHTLGGIVCFGNVLCSPFLLGFCAENNVEVSFLTENGRFLARVQGPVSGNVLLRREQYRKADRDDASAEIAAAIVIGKLANARTVLQRAIRDHAEKTDAEALQKAADRLDQQTRKLSVPRALDEIRGIEGDAAATYFSVFDHLITAQKAEFSIRERSRRPPMDNMNALLSFLYTLLVHDVSAALECVGLDRQVGFLHRDRPGRPGLALDLMEELRPFLADRLAISLVNLKQVQAKGLTKTESGGVVMDDATRKEVLVAYQKRKQEEIRHPYVGETMAIGLIPHVQALLFARYVRGDLDAYPPFVWR
jgi:CRISPR-associated protein Cas1